MGVAIVGTVLGYYIYTDGVCVCVCVLNVTTMLKEKQNGERESE